MIKKKDFFMLLMAVLFVLSFSQGLMAEAWDPNMSGNVSSGGVGSEGNYWTSKWDGYRLTFVTNDSNQYAVTESVDITNYDFTGITLINFQRNGGRCYKTYYASGGGLVMNVDYKFWNTSVTLPNVIGDYGDINGVTARFSDPGTIKGIVQKFIYSQDNYGYSTWEELYNHLTDGTYDNNGTFIPNYKLLIEPVAYFYYNYDFYAMTAAEAARFQQTYGGLAEKMGSLTRNMLPVSMYLSSSDTRLGLLAFPNISSIASNSSYRFSDANILNYGVGCGLISPSIWATVDMTASASANKTSFNSGETVTINATVTNIGTRVAPGTHTSLKERYGKWDGSDAIQVQRNPTNSLAANGGNQTMSFTFTAPTVTAATTYYLAITADSYDVITESDEGNNAAYVTITVNPVSTQPDLTVVSLTPDKYNYTSGETATITMVVKNQGGSNAVIYQDMLRDDTLPGGGAKYFELRKYGLRLNAGETMTYTWTVTMPEVTSTQGLYIEGWTDINNVIAESNENNNGMGLTVTISPPKPDLTVLSVTPNKSTYSSGETATFTMVVKNQGDVDAVNYIDRVRDLQPDLSFIYFITEKTGRSLAAGATETLTFTAAMPTVTASTSITVVGETDCLCVIDESIEDNNYAHAYITVVPGKPDLTITSFADEGNSVYTAGDTITVSMVIKNIGNSTATNFENRIYDFNDTMPKYIFANANTSTLAAGSSKIYSFTFTAPNVATDTFIYIRGITDYGNTVNESNESNNLAETMILVMPNTADLDIEFDEEANGTYYTDTTVITPAKVWSSLDILPSSPGAVTYDFYLEDGTFWDQISLDDVICPEGEQQLVWSKWRTPEEPQEMTMEITWTAAGGSVTKEFPLEIIELEENTPPDTTATDERPSGFNPVIPTDTGKTSNSWTVWEYSSGWIQNTYTAELSCTLDISPHESVPTADGDIMKSGYGVALAGTAEILSDADDSALAAAGIGAAYFPEFNYGDEYFRVLEAQEGSATYAEFIFQHNPLDHYNGRIHFVPIWYPDGPYTVFATYMAAYTPGGELYWRGNDEVTIDGDLFDDWSVTPTNP